MRVFQIEAARKKALLLEKVEHEKASAQKDIREQRQRVLADKTALKAAIAGLREKKRRLEKRNRKLEINLTTLTARQKELLEQVAGMEGDVRELVGFIRINAKDLDALFRRSLQSSLMSDQETALAPIINQAEFPGMKDIHAMVELLFDDIARSGEVKIVKGSFVNRVGEDVVGNLLVLGNFSAAYRIPGETGFLLYSDTSRRLFALSKQPSKRLRKKIETYMAGKSDDVPIDISRGAVLRQMVHRLSLVKQIPRGGAIVWPIIGIAILALFIVLQRTVYLFRKNISGEDFINSLRTGMLQGKWEQCVHLCKQHDGKSIPKVLLAGINNRDLNREDMENVLQEAILNEIPLLERFLSTIGMLAAIAPLLGLLGTVTGMINTFHVITYYGTGDPRMMSGGISEALVTTMLGLTVAIPVMLSHTLLSRKVENMIAQMEEKAVSFVNTLYKAER